MIDTLDFGSITWHPDQRSTSLEATLARFALSPDGAQKMLASESGSLRDLYLPCFAIFKKLSTTSPVTEYLGSPPEAQQPQPAQASQ